MKMPTRCVLALLLALTLQAVLVAHDIPDEIVVQSYVRPQQNQLQVLLRVPLLAIADANLPKDGTGYLALPYIDAALREAANQISNGIVFLEGDERLTRYEMANARISLPSDRSFDTYEGALARARGTKLPDTMQVYYNQGFLDLELVFPIRSETSPFYHPFLTAEQPGRLDPHQSVGLAGDQNQQRTAEVPRQQLADPGRRRHGQAHHVPSPWTRAL